MTLPLPLLLMTVAGLALLSLSLAVPSIRLRLVGGSNVRHALVPIVVAGLLWTTASAADFLKGRLEESTVPDDVLILHVQSVDFGLPRVPVAYRDQDYSNDQLREALAPLTSIKERVVLAPAEVERLNAIAQPSGMLDRLNKNRTFTTTDVAAAISRPLAFTFNYRDWARASAEWARLLDGLRSNVDKGASLLAFIDVIETEITAAGLFQAIIGMADRGSITIPDGKGDCRPAQVESARIETTGQNVHLTFPTFRSLLSDSDDAPGRRANAMKFGRLFEFACLGSLSIVMRQAATDFSEEASMMDRYVDTWNEVLASKRPETIRIRASVSNIGRFDSFVRTSAKVSVGPLGASSPLSFTVTRLPSEQRGDDSRPSGGIAEDSSFIHVPSRSNVVVAFLARLSDEMKEKLYGAYQSEQAFLRLGILASAGASESPVLSQVAPFSHKALTSFEQMINDMTVAIQQ